MVCLNVNVLLQGQKVNVTVTYLWRCTF